MIIHRSLISKSGDWLADCMECDYDIDYDCDVCPHCGLESPVSYKWFNIIYKERIEKLKLNNDLEKLAELYFEAYYEAAMLCDPYVLGDMVRELEKIYIDLGYHDRLIWLYVEDATHPEWNAITDGARKAYLYAKKTQRMDLELYVMEVFDHANARRYRTTEDTTPKDLVDRKKQLLTLYNEGKINDIEFPEFELDMWSKFKPK